MRAWPRADQFVAVVAPSGAAIGAAFDTSSRLKAAAAEVDVYLCERNRNL